MPTIKVASWLVDRVEAGPASDASVSMQPHRRESPIKSASPARPQPAGRRIERRPKGATLSQHVRHQISPSTRLLPESDRQAPPGGFGFPEQGASLGDAVGQAALTDEP